MRPTTVHLQVYDGGCPNQVRSYLVSASTSPTVDTAHVLPLAFIATTPAKYCYRAIATFIKHVTNLPPTASLQQHYEPPALQPSIITLGETVMSPIASSPLGGDRPAASSQAKERTLSRPKGFSRVTSSFRRGSSLFSKSSRSHSEVNTPEDEGAIEDTLAGDPVVYDGRWVSSSVQSCYRNLTALGKISGPSGHDPRAGVNQWCHPTARSRAEPPCATNNARARWCRLRTLGIPVHCEHGTPREKVRGPHQACCQAPRALHRQTTAGPPVPRQRRRGLRFIRMEPRLGARG